MKLTRLQYAAATRDFQAAADLVPSTEALVRSGYLNKLGLAALDAGNYPLARTALAEALMIREKLLDPEHGDIGTSLNNLATLYYFQDRYGQSRSSDARWRSTRRRSARTIRPSPPRSTILRGYTAS